MSSPSFSHFATFGYRQGGMTGRQLQASTTNVESSVLFISARRIARSAGDSDPCSVYASISSSSGSGVVSARKFWGSRGRNVPGSLGNRTTDGVCVRSRRHHATTRPHTGGVLGTYEIALGFYSRTAASSSHADRTRVGGETQWLGLRAAACRPNSSRDPAARWRHRVRADTGSAARDQPIPSNPRTQSHYDAMVRTCGRSRTAGLWMGSCDSGSVGGVIPPG